MSAATEHIARLDRSLARNGETVTLRKAVGTTAQSVVDVDLLAVVIPQAPDQVVGGSAVVQEKFKLITSPTEINAVQWPGGVPPSFVGDPRVPLVGFKVVVRSKERKIDAVMPHIRGGDLVRLELVVAG